MKARVPKNQRSKRAIERMAPKLIENTKKVLLIKGPKSSDVVQKVLKDLYNLKKPDGKMFTKRNMTRPFEDQSSVEFMCRSNDSSLFAYVSHTKKRPQNLVLGRMFDFQVLDMIEFAIDPRTFKPMTHFEGKRKAVLRIGSKPMFVFRGSAFESKDDDFGKFKNLILDFFRGEELTKMNVAGLDRLIVCTAHKGKIFFRHYGILLKNQGTQYPKVELELAGPSMDFTIRRAKYAPAEMQKQAVRKPRGQKSSKRKNMEKGQLGDKLGRVHLGKQDFNEISLAKLKGLKKRKLEDGEAEDASMAQGGEDSSDDE